MKRTIFGLLYARNTQLDLDRQYLGLANPCAKSYQETSARSEPMVEVPLRTTIWTLTAVLVLASGCAGRTANDPAAESTAQEQAKQSKNQPKQMSARTPCQRAGCSKELCVGADSDEVVSACVWHARFACYENAECALQPDGRCGWTETAQLRQCIKDASRKEDATRLE